MLSNVYCVLQGVFMRLVIAAPANGAILKDALKAHLQNDTRVSNLVDLSSPEGSYPQLSFAAAEEVVAGRADPRPARIPADASPPERSGRFDDARARIRAAHAGGADADWRRTRSRRGCGEAPGGRAPAKEWDRT